jgi:ankyrin repeat protein
LDLNLPPSNLSTSRHLRNVSIVATVFITAIVCLITINTASYVTKARLSRELIDSIDRTDNPFKPIPPDDKAAIELLKKGADANVRHTYGDRSITSILKRLIPGRHTHEDVGPGALEVALLWQDPTLMRALLAHGADQNATSWSYEEEANLRMSLLVMASLNSNEIAMRVLLEAGASDVNGKEPSGDSGCTQTFTTWTHSGLPVICRAVIDDEADIVELLLHHGANINEFDDNGRTALMWSVFGTNPSITRILLQRGADVRARDAQGHSAMWVARQTRYEHPSDTQAEAIVKMLKQAGAKE